jgi:hypothetical protein
VALAAGCPPPYVTLVERRRQQQTELAVWSVQPPVPLHHWLEALSGVLVSQKIGLHPAKGPITCGCWACRLTGAAWRM